ncbi:MAG: alpha-L-glutamate ligase [Phycisphaerae bacterium]|nr:alpha-L-glutamate ligase [Phycisphaerae bacterium]
MILIIASEDDEHSQAVLQCLTQQGVEAVVLDLSVFPIDSQLSLSYGDGGGHACKMRIGHNGEVDLRSCRVAWWRRPQPFNLHPDITDPDHRSFAYGEAHEAVSGLWLALDAFWVNHPTRDEEASHKAYHLKVAREVGLEIPATLITNNPDRARAFVEARQPAGTIYKAFSATESCWRETRLLKPEELHLLDNVRFAPVIFQEYVPAALELRVSVVGQEMFAAAIHSQETEYKVDYRMNMKEAVVEPFEVPGEVRGRLRAFMDRLGLVYGAIDMIKRPDGQFVFLEINPSGQWLFIEERTGQPITETFACLLASHDQCPVTADSTDH